MEIKVCSKCKEEKPVGEYGFRDETKNLLRTECKECKKNRDREYYYQHQEVIIARSIQHQKDYPDKARERKRIWADAHAQELNQNKRELRHQLKKFLPLEEKPKIGKFCKKCKEDKELNQFNKLSASKDGLDNYCKSCKAEIQRNRRKEIDRVALQKPEKEGYKFCIKCDVLKPLNQFGKDSKRDDGVFPYCKLCRMRKPEIYLEKLANSDKKKCNECKKWLSFDRFGSNKFHADGKHTHCKECANERVKKYIKNNPEKIKAKSKLRWEKNPEKEKERWQNYYSKNRERLLKKAVEKMKTPEGKAYMAKANHVRRTRVLTAPVTLTAIEWQEILDSQNNSCARCQRPFTKTLKPTKDHIVPVSKGGGLTKENVQGLCRSCNSSKGNRIINYKTGLVVPK